MNTLTEISLESPQQTRQRYRQPKPKVKIMTVGVALICNNAIVMASDSQMSDWETGVTDRDENKITRIDFADGASALVARSGHADYSSQAVERLINAAAAERLDEYRKPAELANAAVAEVKRNIIEEFQLQGDTLVHYFAGHSFTLMVAYYFEGEPYVYIIRSETAGPTLMRGPQPHAKDRTRVAIGCGEVLANFFLSSQDIADMQLGTAIATAIYAVEEVKKADPRCAGPTKAAYTIPVVSRDFPEKKVQTVLMSREEVEERVQRLNKFDADFKAEWKRKLTEMVYGVAREISESGITSSPSLTQLRVDTADTDKKEPPDSSR
jgi:20S proteasome alpha/beta subunit